MPIDVRILLPAHKDAVLRYAKAQLEREVHDPMEREMQGWTARWRPEALDHYLAMGWSYGVFNEHEELEGFLIAQPLLFYRGLTQTLWVEHFTYSSEAAGQSLLDTAYRWARDKHFQCVLIEERPDTGRLVSALRQVQPVATPLFELRSARF